MFGAILFVGTKGANFYPQSRFRRRGIDLSRVEGNLQTGGWDGLFDKEKPLNWI